MDTAVDAAALFLDWVGKENCSVLEFAHDQGLISKIMGASHADTTVRLQQQGESLRQFLPRGSESE